MPKQPYINTFEDPALKKATVKELKNTVPANGDIKGVKTTSNLQNSKITKSIAEKSTSNTNVTAISNADAEQVITTPDGTVIVVTTDKDVYVNTYQDISEQKYISNVTGGGSGAIGVGTITGSTYTNVVAGVCQLGFDTDSGFDVTDLGAGLAKIGMNSTFKFWQVNGLQGLVACGIDTVNFIPGCNISICANNGTSPKTFTISSTVTIDGATPTTLGTTYAYNQPSYCNTFVGYCAGNTTTVGSSNVAVGTLALSNNTTGYGNTAIGYSSLYNNTIGYGNTAVGCGSLYNNTTGYGNTAIGQWTLYCNTIGYGNTAVGYGSLYSNTTGYGNTAIGQWSLSFNTTGYKNIAIGGSALERNTGGYGNVAIGTCSAKCNTTGYGNIAVGDLSLYRNQTGYGNVAIGYEAGRFVEQNMNVMIGFKNFNQSYGQNNIGIGALSGGLNSTGANNIVIGTGSFICNTTGVGNLAIGHESLKHNLGSGSNNIAIGNYSQRCSFYASNNISVGLYAAECIGGVNSVAIGCCTLSQASSIPGNIAIGPLALTNLASSGQGCTDRSSIALGWCAGCAINNGYANTIIGNLPGSTSLTSTVLIAAGTCERIKVDNSGLYINGTCWCSGGGGGASLNSYCSIAIGDGLSSSTGFHNYAIGCYALKCNTTGAFNFAVGFSALCKNTGGQNNIAIGCMTLLNNTTGQSNIALGYGAFYCNTTGCYNIGLGSNSLYNNLTGIQNTAVGHFSLQNNQTGGFNVTVGYLAGSNIRNSCNVAVGYLTMWCANLAECNTAIGAYGLAKSCGIGNASVGFKAGCSINSGTNNTVIGTCAGINVTYGSNNSFLGYCASAATATSCNTITLGNSSITCIRAQVTTISALSDARDKTDIQELQLGLQFIMNLRPVKFTWNMRDGAKVGVQDSGFIAQEVAELEDRYGVTYWLDMVGRENPEKLELKPGKLIPILVKAVQELSSEVNELKNEIMVLKGGQH